MFTEECLIREVFFNVLGLLIKSSRRLVDILSRLLSVTIHINRLFTLKVA